eukprot:9263858-Pyramimonas_sp.AAC.1
MQRAGVALVARQTGLRKDASASRATVDARRRAKVTTFRHDSPSKRELSRTDITGIASPKRKRKRKSTYLT